MSEREFDLVLYGASGFTGRLVAEHVARHSPPGLRVALAGRSAPRLEAVRRDLPLPGRAWSVVTADAMDPVAVDALVRRTRVVATTVGPYARYGVALVTACATTGTHYADLSGEVLFMRESILANTAAATATGARIVHACGFDSVPSDLGVWLLHQQAQAGGAGGLTRVTGLFTGGRGGFSGGTVASLGDQVNQLAADPEARRMAADPHTLDVGPPPTLGSPPNVGRTPTLRRPGPPDVRDVRWDGDLGYWLAPFVMAPLNTRVVRRSHYLLAVMGGTGYGPEFRYREVVGVRGRVRGALPAVAVAGATVAMGAAMAWPPARRLLDRVLPGAGEGPAPHTRAAGYFRVHFVAQTTSGRVVRADVGADLDPGYGATAVMLGESVLALAAGEGTGATGVLTPAVALGDSLVDRLRARGFRLRSS